MLHPRVGTGVWIRKESKILLGFRTWKHAPNTWAPPGGKLEMYEEPAECARRETKEETGLDIENIRFMTITNDVYEDVGQHYITLHFAADWKRGEARLVEPEKFSEWRWFDWGSFPEPLLLSTRNFIKTGYNPINF